MGNKRKTAERSRSHASIDRGWAWICLLGVSMVNMIVIGTFKSFGILYVEAMEMFGTSAGQTAWIFTCVGITNTLLPTPAAALSNRFGNRIVVVFGGVVFACGSMLTTFTTNIVQMTFIFGLFTGAGIGLVYANSMAMIPKYFVKRRAIASGLGVSGSSVGQFVVPLLLRYLMDTFSFHRAMLVYGAFLLNVCLCGAVFRPIKKQIASEKPETTGNVVKNSSKEANYEIENEIEMKPLTGCKNNDETTKVASSDLQANNFDDLQKQQTENADLLRGKAADIKKPGSCCRGTVLDFSIFRESKFLIYLLGTWLATLGYANSFIIIPPNAKHLQIDKQQVAFLLTVIGAGDLIGRISFGFISDVPFVRRHIQRHYIYLVNIGIVGVAHLLCPFAESYVSLVVYCVVLGFFGGGFIALMVVVLADWVGVERINSAMGFTVMVQGFGNTITPLILGHLYDMTGDYAASFHFCGSAMFAGFLVFLFGPWLARKVNRSAEEQTN